MCHYICGRFNELCQGAAFIFTCNIFIRSVLMNRFLFLFWDVLVLYLERLAFLLL